MKILGVCTKELIPKFNGVLDDEDMKGNRIVLFCAHSDFDILMEHTFTCIETDKGEIAYNGQMVLKKVTQQWAKPFDSIPRGYKTICTFEFKENDVPEVIKRLPTITDWYDSKQYLFFR